MSAVSNTVETPTEKPVVIPIEAYVPEAYARAENEKLWPKVWQVACRLEEIPKVGDYVTYDILDESIIVVRSRAGQDLGVLQCLPASWPPPDRGQRPAPKQFRCRFHGWCFGLDGENTFVLDPQDWGTICLANLRLKQVKVDTWGGWVWINMDPNCQPLREYLEPAFRCLLPFELDKMRYRWRQWLYFPCNWKTSPSKPSTKAITWMLRIRS